MFHRVFTALARGIHSPEFIVESLKLGNSPKKLGHDVYCSRCGHLTHFRDATGEEGGASYISLATVSLIPTDLPNITAHGLGPRTHTALRSRQSHFRE